MKVLPISHPQLGSAILFRGLPQEALDLFASVVEQQHVAAGTVLVEAGMECHTLYQVLEGELIVVARNDQSITTMASVVPPGEVAGWSALVPPHRATATIRALTDATVLAFPGAELWALLIANPAHGMVVLRNVAEVIHHRLEDARLRLDMALHRGGSAPG